MKHLAILFAIIALTGCTSLKSLLNKDDDEISLTQVKDETPSAQELYDKGLYLLEKKRYKKAIEKFEEIERVYPFSKLAPKSQTIVAYTNYKDEEYDDAVNVINNFTRLNPGHSDTPYMYYLKALCYYDRIANIKRDQKITTLALSALKETVSRYPSTQYSRDASLKIDLVRDHLAGKQMEIGFFYLKNKKYIAAINRFKQVVKKYEDTSHVEEALYRLTESYLLLGITEEATKNAATLGHNYPDSKWYKYSYNLINGGKSQKVKSSKIWDIFNTDAPNNNLLGNGNLADNVLTKIKSIFR